MTIRDLDNAKKAFDHAWGEATKFANEALEAMKTHEQVQARDTGSIFSEKAERAMLAHENWLKAARVAAKVMEEYYDRFRAKS